MPNKNEVYQKISELKTAGQDTVRRSYLSELHEYTKRDTILYASDFMSKKLPQIPQFLISVTLEDVQSFMSALHGLKGTELDLVLHSPGGSLEAADQIVQYLRSKYKHIRAIVPQNAMSATTMIACACDEIVMGKHSALGPIDPQITFPSGNGHFTAPAQSILDEFDQAKAEVSANPSSAVLWINKMQSYPQGFLKICQDTIDLSKTKVAEWLNKYMFKENTTKAKEIADWLGDTKAHKSHGRPIMMDLAKEKGLKIVELEKDQLFQEKVLPLFHATMATFDMTGCMKIVENQSGKGNYLIVQVPGH